MAFFLSTSILSPSSTTTLITNLSTKFILKSKNSSLHLPFPGELKRKDLCVCLSVKAASQSTIQKTNRNPRKSKWRPLLSEGRDEDEEYGLVCPGCGVFMQDEDENLPGYYQKRKIEAVDMSDEEDDEDEDGLEMFDEEEEDFEDEIKGEIDESGVEDEDLGDEIEGKLTKFDLGGKIEGTLTKFDLGDDIEGKLTKFDLGDEGDGDVDEWDSDFDDDDDDDDEDEDESESEDENSVELDGFAAPGVGYGNITEESLEKGKKKRISKSERKQIAREALTEREEVTVCARCHSLRNYGQVKNQTAENLIPDFDFDRIISTRLMKPTGKPDSVVVVIVVDCVDFDGSFPKRAAKSLFKALEGTKSSSNVSKKLPKLVLVATKVDLLPSQISPTRLDRWIRHRAKANGAPKLSGVYMVSSRKDLGVRNLLGFVKELAGPRGNVWVIGAQNAGKSTLINAFAKKQGVKVSKLTEAAIPGTTLGILRIGGVLPAKAKMYDTPGLLHPYLMTMRLNRDEQKMVELRKELRPRSFRIKQGQTIHVGALMRLDLNKASVETIYVTVWASPNVSLHLGKTENADEIWSKHAGFRLQPPVGRRVNEMGEWIEREVNVKGTSWDVNSIDISIAGLGWVSLGLKGEATLTFFTYEGIEVILREPLVLDRARFLERPGFCLPKGLSEAINNQIKLEAQSKNDHQEQNEQVSV